MTTRSFLARALTLLTCLLLASTLSFAQAIYGTLTGTVTDPQGAAVANAKVTVTDVGKGTSTTTTTNESGFYTVTHLIPGIYAVKLEASGFKAAEAQVRVFADQTHRVDAALQVGGATETVEVTGEVPILKTERADVSTTLTERIAELPIFERNFTALQLITPGTQKLAWQHASAENPQGSIQIMVNGQHFSGTSFQLDGTDNRDPILGIIVVNPTLESVTEAKITTQNYDAEFGQALAAVVTAQTKSGTNEFHGSGFWFRRTEWAQARNPFNQPPGFAFPDTLWNQFGGSIGGPIIKNRTFFFTDYQATRSKQGNSILANLPRFPTPAARQACIGSGDCDLSLYAIPVPAGGAGVTIFDPTTGLAFPGNIIPASRVSPQARQLLALLPEPNLPGTLGGVQSNYAAGGIGVFDADAWNVRIDHQLGPNVNLFGRYSIQDFTQSANGAYGEIIGGPGLGIAGFGGDSLTRNHSLASGFNWTLSPTLLTDFRFGWFKYHVDVLPKGSDTFPLNDLSPAAPGLNIPSDPFTAGMPAFFISGSNNDPGGFAFGYGLSDRLTRCNCPLLENEWQIQFVNNWTKISGNHQMKFGADIRYANNLRVASDSRRAGELSFNRERTQGPNSQGLGFATFLLGDVSVMSRYVSSTLDAKETQDRHFFYGQDTWRVTPRLTVNYGLRWELYWPQTVNEPGNGGWLDPETGEIRVGGVGPIDLTGNTEMTYSNFAPRFGISYQLTDKTVVRMGYGRSFDIGVFGSIFGHSVTQNLPVLTRQEVRPASGDSDDVAFNLAVGPPAFDFSPFEPDPSTGTFPLAPGNNQYIQPLEMRLPTVDAWNITIQHQLTPSMSAEVGYVANKGTHVFAGDGPDYNCNQPSVAGYGAGVPQAQRRPFFPLFGWNQDLRCHLSDASNNYHSLQTRFEKRFSGGLQFLAHYTWAKSMNFDGDYYVHEPRIAYGPSSFDRTHVFVITNLWEIPFGRGKRYGSDVARAVDWIIGGWQLNSTTNWSSGLPFTPTYSLCRTEVDVGPCRPNRVGDVEIVADDRRDADSNIVWYAGTGAQLANPGDTIGPWQRPSGIEQFGDAGRNSLRGPSFFNTDLAIFKNVSITERVKTQFRAEIFNVFNVANWGQPADCVDCGNAGEITSLASGATMRNLTFGLRVTF